MAVSADGLREIDRANNCLERRCRGNRERLRVILCRRCPLFEQQPRLRVDRRRIVAVLLVELENVAAIEPRKLLPAGHVPYDFSIAGGNDASRSKDRGSRSRRKSYGSELRA